MKFILTEKRMKQWPYITVNCSGLVEIDFISIKKYTQEQKIQAEYRSIWNVERIVLPDVSSCHQAT